MTSCRSCGSTALETFLSLGDMPLADGLLSEEALSRPEARYPLDVAVCPDCTLMQILETVPPEELFGPDFPYYSSFSDTLLQHSEANATGLVESRRLGAGSLVVELASNDGYLLQFFAARGVPEVKGVHWLEEMGMPEALWVLEGRDFGPTTVAIDATGTRCSSGWTPRSRRTWTVASWAMSASSRRNTCPSSS